MLVLSLLPLPSASSALGKAPRGRNESVWVSLLPRAVVSGRALSTHPPRRVHTRRILTSVCLVSFPQSTTRVKPFICTMPMRLDEGWNQIQFNLSDFTRRAYGAFLSSPCITTPASTCTSQTLLRECRLSPPQRPLASSIHVHPRRLVVLTPARAAVSSPPLRFFCNRTFSHRLSVLLLCAALRRNELH